MLDTPASTHRPTLLVLSTLHKYHAEVAAYGYGTLRQILEHLAPEDLLIEVSESDLAGRKDEGMKREYPEVVYPFLDRWPSVRAHALEPSGEKRDALIHTYLTATEQFMASPGYAAFEVYVHEWFQRLLSRFRTAAELNSPEIDEMIRGKHEYQSTLYPRAYTEAWEEWNRHFHDRIVQVVNHRRPGVAVALVGLEHSYWLRARLAARSDMVLLDASQVLRAI